MSTTDFVFMATLCLINARLARYAPTRQGRRDGRLLFTGLTFYFLFQVVPLTAQQTVVVPDVIVEVQVQPTPIEIILEVPPPDSATVVKDEATQRAMESIADYLENCGCLNQGTSTVTRVGQGALVLAAFFIGWQLKRIADKEEGDHNTSVEVNIPPHEHGDDHGKGKQSR